MMMQKPPLAIVLGGQALCRYNSPELLNHPDHVPAEEGKI